MFDISSWEILVIGIVILIVVGPERLPGLATKAGRWVARVRRFVSNVKSDIDREIQQEQIKEALARNADLDEIKSIINDAKYTIEDEVTKVQQEYVVAARDDDPGRDGTLVSNEQLLKEQEEGFDDIDENKAYGHTSHIDITEELDREYEREQAELQKQKAKNDGPDNKSNG